MSPGVSEMVHVRPVRHKDIEEICQFMHQNMNPRIAPERWRRLFDYAWLEDKPDLGFVVDTRGRVGGFMGTIYHRRIVSERLETFCNLSSWYVARPFRGGGVGQALLNCFLTQRHRYHYSVLSPARKTVETFRRRGFPPLDTHRYVLATPPKTYLSPENNAQVEISTDPWHIRDKLPVAEGQILEDHLPYGCRHFWVRTSTAACYLVVKDFPRKNGGRRAEILYATSYRFIEEHGPLIAALVRYATDGDAHDAGNVDTDTVVTLDSRFLQRPPAGAIRKPLPMPRYGFSDRIPASTYAGIYSEAILLDYDV